jgi:hypothetical protein
MTGWKPVLLLNYAHFDMSVSGNAPYDSGWRDGFPDGASFGEIAKGWLFRLKIHRSMDIFFT